MHSIYQTGWFVHRLTKFGGLSHFSVLLYSKGSGQSCFLCWVVWSQMHYYAQQRKIQILLHTYTKYTSDHHEVLCTNSENIFSLSNTLNSSEIVNNNNIFSIDIIFSAILNVIIQWWSWNILYFVSDLINS